MRSEISHRGEAGASLINRSTAPFLILSGFYGPSDICINYLYSGKNCDTVHLSGSHSQSTG